MTYFTHSLEKFSKSTLLCKCFSDRVGDRELIGWVKEENISLVSYSISSTQSPSLRIFSSSSPASVISVLYMYICVYVFMTLCSHSLTILQPASHLWSDTSETFCAFCLQNLMY